jgi:protocatechuate 3,4-dioxygenase beta subunit
MLIPDKKITILIFSIVVLMCAAALPEIAVSAEHSPQKANTHKCYPTEPDMEGPFYKPNAPVRSKIGEGYTLKGTVRSVRDCAIIPDARVEVWVAGPDGEYSDDYRATVVSDATGIYQLSSHFPPGYYGRPPHFHIRLAVDGYRTLITQHYPAEGSGLGEFDLVLIPFQ